MAKQKSTSMQDLPRIAWQRILQEFQSRTTSSRPRAIKVGSSIQEIASQIRLRQSPRFFGLIVEQAALLVRFYPDILTFTLKEAVSILDHRFRLDDNTVVDLGKEIDWHRDSETKHIWPLEPVSRLKSKINSKTNPRSLWQVSRFHQLVRLGQAYLFTEDERYAQEIIEQVESWIKANPDGFGVNWADPITVAIRTVNWIWAYYFILESKSLNDKFLALWLASLKTHGQYLAKNGDEKWPHTPKVTAVCSALAYAGILFPEFPEASRWRSVGLARLWEVLEREVHPDGFYYAGSTDSHRFVMELALSVMALCIVNGIDIPEAAHARMRSMLDIVMTCADMSGWIPPLGHSRNDRALRLSVYDNYDQEQNDYRYLLSLGSLVLERQLSEWAGFIEPTSRGWSLAAGDQWQDAFWYFASDAAARLTDVITRTTVRPENVQPDSWIEVGTGIRVRARALAHKPTLLSDIVGSRGFESSGLYVMRLGDFHMLVNASIPGMDGSGLLSHNDTFSVTMAAYGRKFIIDPGTIEAKSDRESSRSIDWTTSSHNVLQIGDAELYQHRNKDVASSTSNMRITVHHWKSDNNYDLFDASHDGYGHLIRGLVHRRQIWLDKTARLWVIHDQVKVGASSEPAGEQEIDVSIWFHLGNLPVKVDRANNAARTVVEEGPNLVVLPLGDFRLEPQIKDTLYSPHYGVADKGTSICFSGKVKLPADFILMLYPHRGDVDLKTVRAAGRTALVNFRKAFEPSSSLVTKTNSARLAPTARSGKRS